jgi:hypothetical protein
MKFDQDVLRIRMKILAYLLEDDVSAKSKTSRPTK